MVPVGSLRGIPAPERQPSGRSERPQEVDDRLCAVADRRLKFWTTAFASDAGYDPAASPANS